MCADVFIDATFAEVHLLYEHRLIVTSCWSCRERRYFSPDQVQRVAVAEVRLWASRIWAVWFCRLSPTSALELYDDSDGVCESIRLAQKGPLQATSSDRFLFVVVDQVGYMPRSSGSKGGSCDRRHRAGGSEKKGVLYLCGICKTEQAPDPVRLKKKADVRSHAIRTHGMVPIKWKAEGYMQEISTGYEKASRGLVAERRLSVRRKGRRIELIISAPRRQGGVLVRSLSNLRGEGALGPRTTLGLRQEATVRKLEPDLRQHPPAAHQVQTQAAILRRVRRLRL